MPVVASLMESLQARYGEQEGRRIYYAMEAEGKGPFGPRGKYRKLHEAFAARNGVQPIEGKKKPPASKKPGAKKRR